MSDLAKGIGLLGGVLLRSYIGQREEAERRRQLEALAQQYNVQLPPPQEVGFLERLVRPDAGQAGLSLQQALVQSVIKQRMAIEQEQAEQVARLQREQTLETQRQGGRETLQTMEDTAAMERAQYNRTTPPALTPEQLDSYRASAAASRAQASIAESARAANFARAAASRAGIPFDQARAEQARANMSLQDALRKLVERDLLSQGAEPPPTSTLPEWGATATGAPPPPAPAAPTTERGGLPRFRTSFNVTPSGTSIGITPNQVQELPANMIAETLGGFADLGNLMGNVGSLAGEGVSRGEAAAESLKQKQGFIGLASQMLLPGTEQAAAMGTNIASLKNALVRITTGLQMSRQEEERILGEISTLEDYIGDPQRFKTRLRTALDNAKDRFQNRIDLLRESNYFVPNSVDKNIAAMDEIIAQLLTNQGDDEFSAEDEFLKSIGR